MSARFFLCFVLIGFLGLFVAGASAQQAQPSLGEVAKHKSGHKASRVITEDDIPGRPEETVDPSTAMSSPESNDTGHDDKKTVISARPEDKTTSNDLKSMQGELQTLSNNLADRQKRTEEYRQKMEQETDEFRRNTQSQVLAAREAEEKRMVQRRDELQGKISAAQTSKDQKSPTSTSE